MSATIQHATRTPKDTQELQRAQNAVSRFVRSLQVLLRAARLYQKNHPHVMESLEAADKDLRSALDRVAPLEIRFERGHLTFRGNALADSRGELKTLADHILRRGISTLVFSSVNTRAKVESCNPETGEYRIVLQGTLDMDSPNYGYGYTAGF